MGLLVSMDIVMCLWWVFMFLMCRCWFIVIDRGRCVLYRCVVSCMWCLFCMVVMRLWLLWNGIMVWVLYKISVLRGEFVFV